MHWPLRESFFSEASPAASAFFVNAQSLTIMSFCRFFGLGILVLAGTTGSAHANAPAEGGRVVADLYREWGTALPARSQPLGGWLLLRGAKDAPLDELVPLDRFEQGVGGNPDVAIWSYGNRIHNEPGFTRTIREGAPLLRTHPEKDYEKNDHKGSAYMQWTSPVSGEVRIVLSLQNLGTDVKGGAGMIVTVRQYEPGSRTAFTALARLPVPNAATSPSATVHEIPARAVEGQIFLIQISPVADGYGNNLAFLVRVIVP
jgi:hypothetical protein